MSPHRAVAVLTPLVFAPAAGWIAAWAARNMPGLPKLDPAQVTAVFIAGATIAFGKAALWLHGWQQFMQSPDGRVGAPQDDGLDLPGPDLTDSAMQPLGSYDPVIPFEAQPHHENGHVPGAALVPEEVQ